MGILNFQPSTEQVQKIIFCGSYDFEIANKYIEFSNPYTGLHQVIRPDGTYKSQQRFGMYRWHIMDPIRFDKNLKVTIQDLGWRDNGKYLAQKIRH